MATDSKRALPPDALGFGKLVNTAYNVYGAFPNKLNPSEADYRPFLPDGYQVVLNIQMTDFFDKDKIEKYYGFYALQIKQPGALIVVFRGTETWQEWWDDFDWALVPSPYMSKAGYVANGFLKIYETFSVTSPASDAPPTLLKDKMSLPGDLNLDESLPLVTVGHSLGGGLSTLYAAEVASRGKTNPTVYTLASPRVGDKAFADAYNATIANNYRVYNWPDLVPKFPKDPVDNYHHVKGGYEVDSLDHPETVEVSVDCFHSILTYLFLIGAPSSILGACAA
jgi:hypothetical protein